MNENWKREVEIGAKRGKFTSLPQTLIRAAFDGGLIAFVIWVHGAGGGGWRRACLRHSFTLLSRHRPDSASIYESPAMITSSRRYPFGGKVTTLQTESFNCMVSTAKAGIFR